MDIQFNNNDKYAYLTFLIGDNLKYLNGLFVLAKSLKDVKSRYPLYVVMPKKVSKQTIEKVKQYSLGSEVLLMDELNIQMNIDDDRFKYWEATMFRFNVAKMVQFKKVVMIDSDMLILKNIDDVFDYPHLSGVTSAHVIQPKWVMPNGGLLVIEPNIDYFQILLNNIDAVRKQTNGLFSDQDVFYSTMIDWPNKKELHIPEEYNEYYRCVGKLAKTLPNGWKDIKVIHYWGKTKPWDLTKKQRMVFYIKNILNSQRDINKCMMLFIKCLKKMKRYHIKLIV